MSDESLNPQQRFSDRVADYERYRPSYPSVLLDELQKHVDFSLAQIADIGAGTGIFTRLLLERGAQVAAVEPNREMRESMVRGLSANGMRHGQGAGESPRSVAPRSRLSVLEGSAEHTGLAQGSIDLITCAQAFHWFRPEPTRAEFTRILKPEGRIALIWNDLDLASDLAQEYEAIKVKYGGADFAKVFKVTQDLDQVIPEFFATRGGFEAKVFSNYQDLDLAGFIGRYFSSSYAPKSESPDRVKSQRDLEVIFARYAENDVVRLIYKTELFLGR